METAKLLSLAKSAAREAGKLLHHKGKKLLTVHERIGHDIKIEADRAAERLIRRKLEKTGIPIIGEEFGGDEKLMQGNDLYWAVDPLDGTVNYFSNIPFSCCSIGLWRGLTPVLGVIYDFWHNELYCGSDMAATLNGKPLKTPQDIADKKEANAAIVVWPLPLPQNINNLMTPYRMIRGFGSCALHLAYISAGRLGAFYETINVWDASAGLAILQAAGGAMRIKSTSGYRVEVSAAWNEALLPEIDTTS